METRWSRVELKILHCATNDGENQLCRGEEMGRNHLPRSFSQFWLLNREKKKACSGRTQSFAKFDVGVWLMKEGIEEKREKGWGKRGWRGCWRKTSEQRLMSRTKKVTLQRSGRLAGKTKEYKWPTGSDHKNQGEKAWSAKRITSSIAEWQRLTRSDLKTRCWCRSVPLQPLDESWRSWVHLKSRLIQQMSRKSSQGVSSRSLMTPTGGRPQKCPYQRHLS